MSQQVERVITIMQNPRQYKIPDWFLNRQKDVKDGKYSQVKGGDSPPMSPDVPPGVPSCFLMSPCVPSPPPGAGQRVGQ